MRDQGLGIALEAVEPVPLRAEHVGEHHRLPRGGHHLAVVLVRLDAADIERDEQHVVPRIGDRCRAMELLLAGQHLVDRVGGLSRIGIHGVVETQFLAGEQLDQMLGLLARQQFAADDRAGRAAREHLGLVQQRRVGVVQALQDGGRQQATDTATDKRDDCVEARFSRHHESPLS